MTDTNKTFLIWSRRHAAWWGPNGSGYTKDVCVAGRYSAAEAQAIVIGPDPRFPRTTERRVPLGQRHARVGDVNTLLSVIAHRGRRFFYHDTRETRFQIDGNGKVWILDGYSGTRVYTHYHGNWRGFTQGGTLRRLCEFLRDYIRTGARVPAGTLGPWPTWICNGDLWGYGADMQHVRDAATRLGIVDRVSEPAALTGAA